MDWTFDFFVDTMTHALEMFERSISDNDALIIELVRRCKKLCEHLRIKGIKFTNMTYEEFCTQCEKKKNIVFMSDEEIVDHNKAMRVYYSIVDVVKAGDVDKFSVL